MRTFWRALLRLASRWPRGERSVGVDVRLAVEAAARLTRSNTNLGIVLLFAPLARAASLTGSEHVAAATLKRDGARGDDDRGRERGVRGDSSRTAGGTRSRRIAGRVHRADDDARRGDAAGGAQGHFASEYATGFEVTFGTAVPALERARRDGLPWDDAVVETFLTILAAIPDTHIARRSGAGWRLTSRRVRGRCLRRGSSIRRGRRAIDELDRGLRDARNSGNPGTTADLTAAAIFVVLLGTGW